MTPSTIKAFKDVCLKQADMSDKNAIFVTCEGQVYVTGTNIGSNGVFSISSKDVAKLPVLVSSLQPHKVVMASVGDNHFVVLTNQGRVYTWGFNHDGQLGYGNEVPFSAQPLEVGALASSNVRLVNAGGNRTGALTDDGKLFMWGSGAFGEMGDGSTRSHRKPTLVQAFLGNNERVCQVAIGSQHVAAITNAGDLYTWGNGEAGQLGLGDFGLQRKKPMPVTKLRRNVCFVSAGEDFTAIVSQDNRVFLWGSNGYPSPFEKTFYQGQKPRQIACGSAHMIVVLADGRVTSWGSKKYGQTGRGFDGDFTLEPGFLELGSPTHQVIVGKQSSMALGGLFSAPSLCSCGDGWFSKWREEKFISRCTESQNTCGDGSCCGEEETCCAVKSSKAPVSVTGFRGIDEKPPVADSYRCMPAKNAVCCDSTSELACAAGFACHLETSPQRCEPTSVHADTPEEQRAENSEEPLRSKVFSSAPGVAPGQGVCGVRKTTCPDDTCCAKGQTCCPKEDGSFGCCQLENGVCCKDGCCHEGYTCDDQTFACVKKQGPGSAVVRYEQSKVEGHCGPGKRACPDRSCCSNGYECCALGDGFFGCCPFTNGVCCVDGAGCCPSNHRCDVPKNECVRIADPSAPGASSSDEGRVSMKSTPRNTPQRSAVGEVTCPNDMVCQYPGTCCEGPNGSFGCCDFVNGTCCGGGLGCCPSDFECDISSSSCKPFNPRLQAVPMKFTKDPKPKQHTSGTAQVCEGKTKCSDNNCCPLGSSCCAQPDGSTKCCDYMEAVCCADGGCCGANHVCDNEQHLCRDKEGKQTYAHLSSQKSTPPPQDKSVEVSSPGKCYPDENMCSDGFCCPRGGTCCSKGFGQSGCCPHTHGVCCNGGGCCPSGSTCDVQGKSCTYPNQPEKQAAPMLLADPPRPPEAQWDLEECWNDEQSCAVDGGCCLKTETCCAVTGEDGKPMSACCPFENGVCCQFGGCCPQESTCDEIHGQCLDLIGNPVKDVATVKGSALHPLAGLAEIDCPDGSVCGPYDTCCSLGFDEEWGEEIFGCCEFENAVCCKEFEGCCPSGYECNAETKTCINEGRELPGSSNSPTDPPPTFVCLLPLTQCPNGRCCESNEYCAEQGSGNFKCLPRGYSACHNGTHGCQNGLFCDERNGNAVCSAEEPNDPQVKKDLLRKFWGDDVSATCSSLLIQSEAAHSGDAFSPEVKVEKPPKQYWFPTRLAVRSKAVKATDTSLPTVLAAKICQHLPLMNSTAATEYCYLSNSNGHFLMKDRDRVKQLVDEYIRRISVEQHGMAPVGRVYEFQAEELDPCPCRERPTPAPLPPNLDVVAGSNDAAQEAIINEVAKQEQATSNSTHHVVVVVEVHDEKVISGAEVIGGAASSGSVPLSEERPIEVDSVKYTLVLPNQDSMQVSQSVDQLNDASDHDMVLARRVETFMGKESCKEDGAEAAVDLDGEEANDVEGSDARDSVQTTLAQMEANRKSADNSMMPE